MPPGDGLGELDARDVRGALEELLAWEAMKRSPQLAAFLTYVVEARLRGDADNVKAYSIAVDVLGRGEDFDPQSDPIVRVQARRLRNLLSTFYDSGLSRSPVRIQLPVGRYVPDFVTREVPPAISDHVLPSGSDPQASGARSSSSRNGWLVGIAATIILAAAIIFWPSLAERTNGINAASQPQMPIIIVEEFENLASDQYGPPLTGGLAVELVSHFSAFHDISARYGGLQAALSPAEQALGRPIFRLTGVARRVAEGIQYSALLTVGLSDTGLASVDFVVPLTDGRPSLTLSEVARYIAMRIGSPRGVMHQQAREWLVTAAAADQPLQIYPCIVAYSLYRETRSETDTARVKACSDRLAEQYWEAEAISAKILADASWVEGITTEQGDALLAAAEAKAVAVRDSHPDASFAWSAAAHVSLLKGDLELARNRYNSSLQLNPAANDVRADYAHVLAKVGNWADSMRLTRGAMEAEGEPPSWYYLTPALHALRMGDYDTATEYALRTSSMFRDTSAAILLAAAGAQNDLQMIGTYMPRILAGQRFRQMGILPALRQQIADPELMRQFSNGMSAAGVPIDRLARPF